MNPASHPTSPLTNPEPPRAAHLWFERGRLVVQLQDGRELACPPTFFQRLAAALAGDLADWRFTGRGAGTPYLHAVLEACGLPSDWQP
jgi:hypothetical protein